MIHSQSSATATRPPRWTRRTTKARLHRLTPAIIATFAVRPRRPCRTALRSPLTSRRPRNRQFRHPLIIPGAMQLSASPVLREPPQYCLTSLQRSAQLVFSVIAILEFPMFKNSWPLVMFAVTLAASTARAHEIVANRFFPATLAIDDPGVTDELALPTVSMSKTGDPSFKQLDISAEYAKCITEDLAVSVAPSWSRLYAPDDEWRTRFPECGDAVEVPTNKNAEHEFVMSARLEIEWGGSGAQGV